MFARDFLPQLKTRIREPLNFVQVLLGPRQVGKTTAVEELISEWNGSHIFETADRIAAPDSRWIDLHWRRARELPSPVLLVFDEIQKVEGWSERIKVLFDEDRKKRNLRVILLGSASLSIQRGLTESLTGRYEIIPAHHWDYLECNHAFGWDLNTFLKFGGYPGGAELTSNVLRWQDFMQKGVLEPVFSRDLLHDGVVNKPALFRQAFELCLKYPAQELSLNKILGSLQDKGNVTTIRHYLDLYEAAFLLRTLSKYSGAAHVAKSSIPKILPLAPALIHAVTSPLKINDDPDWRGRVFEAVVGSKLNQMRGKLFYWREGNYEVDFVFESDEKLYAIEVKSGRMRKNTFGLQQFLATHKKAVPVIIDPSNFDALLKVPTLEEFHRG